MKITHITVSASRTFNHPHERYANFRFEIRQEAELSEDDAEEARQALLISTERAAEAHKARILVELERVQQIEDLRWTAHHGATEEQKQEAIAKIARLEAEPTLLFEAEKHIHPGHPDHPETHDLG